MSAILLAATLRDGRAVMNASPWTIGQIVAIVTPRTASAARGLSVDHIYRTPAFRALEHHNRNPVEFFAAPAIATSHCAYCLDGEAHGLDVSEPIHSRNQEDA